MYGVSGFLGGAKCAECETQYFLRLLGRAGGWGQVWLCDRAAQKGPVVLGGPALKSAQPRLANQFRVTFWRGGSKRQSRS